MNETEQLEQRIQELMALWDASKELNSHLEQDKVFDNILQQMMHVIGAEAGTLWIADTDGQHLQAVSAFGAAAEEILDVKVPRGQGVVWKVLETGQAERIEDVTRHADWNERIDRESGFITSSLLTVPLIVKSQLLGSLQLLNKRDGEFFTEHDLRLAEALAHQSALALHATLTRPGIRDASRITPFGSRRKSAWRLPNAKNCIKRRCFTISGKSASAMTCCKNPAV